MHNNQNTNRDTVEVISNHDAFVHKLKTSGRKFINNQCLALYSDIPSQMVPYFHTYVTDPQNPAKTDKIRGVIMMQRILGGLGFPGGKVEETDESLFGAALREFKEEVGLDLAVLQQHGFIENTRRDELFLFDSQSSCFSGMHMLEVKPGVFFQTIQSIMETMASDATKLVENYQDGGVNTGDRLLRELCAVFPVFLHGKSMYRLGREAAFPLVNKQLRYCYDDFNAKFN